MNNTHIFVILISLLVGSIQAESKLPHDVSQLISQRNRAIANINVQYQKELKKLRIKYTKKGNLEVANSVDQMIKDLGGDKSTQGVVGVWEFEYEGKKRIFEFAEDAKFTGAYLKSGKKFIGEWILEDGKIILRELSGKKMPQYITIVSSDDLIFIGPAGSMKGVRK